MHVDLLFFPMHDSWKSYPESKFLTKEAKRKGKIQKDQALIKF